MLRFSFQDEALQDLGTTMLKRAVSSVFFWVLFPKLFSGMFSVFSTSNKEGFCEVIGNTWNVMRKELLPFTFALGLCSGVIIELLGEKLVWEEMWLRFVKSKLTASKQ